MTWRTWMAVGVLGVVAALPAWAQGPGRDVETRRVVCTATTAHLVAGRDHPRDLTVSNRGTINAYLAGTRPTESPRITLHAGTSRDYLSYRGGLVCNTAGEYGGTGSTTVEVEELVQ